MNKRQLLISAAVAGILSAGPLVKTAMADEAADSKGKCQEKNDCHGKGSCTSVVHCGEKKEKNHCKAAQNDCSGKNSCKNHVFSGTKSECDKVKGKWSKA